MRPTDVSSTFFLTAESYARRAGTSKQTVFGRISAGKIHPDAMAVDSGGRLLPLFRQNRPELTGKAPKA